MNKKILTIILSACILFPIVAFGANLPDVISRVSKEIDGRIANLNRVITRIDGLKRLSTDQKNQIKSPITDIISQLAELKVKVDKDTDMATATQDFKSVTQSYRVYALVMPRASIALAGERVNHVSGLLQTVKDKIQRRLDKITPGTDVLAITQLLSDFDVKILDARSKVEGAISEIASLQPDNGDQTLMQANLNALKDARDRIKSAQQSIKDARRDLGDAIKLIRELEAK